MLFSYHLLFWMNGSNPLLQHLFPIMERCSSWGQTCESGCLILFFIPWPCFCPSSPWECHASLLHFEMLEKVALLFPFRHTRNCSHSPAVKDTSHRASVPKCNAIWLSQPFCLYKWANSAHIIQLIYCCLNPRVRGWEKSKLIPSIPRWFSNISSNNNNNRFELLLLFHHSAGKTSGRGLVTTKILPLANNFGTSTYVGLVMPDLKRCNY